MTFNAFFDLLMHVTFLACLKTSFSI